MDVLRQNIGLYFKNQSWLTVYECYKKCLNLTPAPKIALKGKKKAKKTPIVEKYKQKIGLYFQNPNLLYTLVGPKNEFEPQTQ